MFGLNSFAKRNDAVESAQPGCIVNVDVGVSEVSKLLAFVTVNKRLMAYIGAAAQEHFL